MGLTSDAALGEVAQLLQAENRSTIRQFPITLVAAEARMILTAAAKTQKVHRIVVEFAPAAFTGDVPGIEFRVLVAVPRLLTFGRALQDIRKSIDQGVGTVPDTNYARVNVELSDGAQVPVFLTASDCELIGITIAEAAAFATM